ncbi:MAG: TetR/AcrR family transcriptional regulator [Candidatus Dormibacteria bacterium]
MPVATPRERAIATRQRMVEAAYKLMSTRGYRDTKMADIAREAGVAIQTVYFTFHNKPAVLRAAFEFGVKGDHLAAGPAGRPWFRVFEEEPDHERALAMFVDACTTILRRILPLAAVVSALAEDPEIAEFHAFSERLRRDGFRRAVDSLALKRPLRSGLSGDDATTILMVLVGTDVYRSMLKEHGWAEEKWRSWVIATVREELFGPAPGTRGRR